MTYPEFASAVLVILLSPGPTNTLIGLAGARKGMTAVIRFMPAEILGYLTALVPLGLVGGHVAVNLPAAAIVLKVAAAAWVMYLAVKLWGATGDTGNQGQVTFSRLYVTTMLNPKALIFGLVLLPSPWVHEYPLRVGLFVTLVGSAAIVWGIFGSLSPLGEGGGSRLIVLQRVASVWLAVVSAGLLAGTLRG